MRREGKYDPLVFARVFIAGGGVQIPGQPDNEAARRRIADLLLGSLVSGHPVTDDKTVVREFHRARAEANWTEAAERDEVVGFRLKLSPAAWLNPACRRLGKEDHGLGSMVFRKGEIIVLPPECDGTTFIPVRRHELEE